MNENKPKIAVIGGGVSGITALKYLKERNLSADLFDGREGFGGLWNPSLGFVWGEMTTNLSQYNTQFSDFLWPVGPPKLVPSKEVYSYIDSYVKHFKLFEFHKINFNCFVNNISKYGEEKEDGKEEEKKNPCSDPGREKYKIEILYLDPNIKDFNEKKKNYLKKETLIYDDVIICVGPNNDYKLPEVENFDNFKGEYIHSSRFKNPEELVKKYKNILVVGAAASGINMIEHLNVAKNKLNLDNKLSISFRTLPYLYMSDFFEEKTGKFMTNDARFFKRKTDEFMEHYMNEEELNTKWQKDKEGGDKHASTFYSDLFPLFDKLGLKYSPIVRSSAYKDFLQFLRNNELNLVPKIKRVVGRDSKVIEFVNDEKSEYDLIIFGTGFNANFKFFDKKILDDIEYDFDNYMYPVSLYKGIFHNKHKGLFFIGAFCRLYITGAELQSQYITSLISKEREYPNEIEFQKILEKELILKKANQNKIENPWSNFLYWDNLAKDLGCYPDFKKIKEKDKKLYDILIRLPVYGFQYRLFKDNEFVEKEEFEKLRNYILEMEIHFK